MNPTYPPGPDGGFLGLGNLLRYQAGGLKFLAGVAETCGDIAFLPMGGGPLYLLNHPRFVEQVLAGDRHCFQKPEFIKASNRGHWGDGLTTLEGETWGQRRRMLQPAFHERRVAAFAGTIVECARDLVAAWQPGQVVDLDRELLVLTARIAARTLFDAELEGFGSAPANRRRSGIIPLAEALGEDFTVPAGGGPVLTRRRAGPQMEATLRLIEARFAARPEDRGDMLSFLLQATAADGNRLGRREIRDELLQMFFAGHHTIPLTLTRLWRALWQNPEVEARLYEESARTLSLETLSGLPYGEMVIKETMRYHPPAVLLSRQVVREVEVGGYALQPGSLVWISPYLLHHDPRNFEQPERFRPARFSRAAAGQIPKYAYLPFGAGPRICIGRAFSMLALRLILAVVAQAYHLRPLPGPALASQELSSPPTHARVVAR